MAPLQVKLPDMRVSSAPLSPPQIQKEVRNSFGSSGIFEIGMVDTAPKLQRYVPPLYPPKAKGKRVEGKVVIRCVVTADGKVKDATIISANPPGFFEATALKAVAKWTFIAARYQDKNVSVYVDIPLSFSLD